MSVPDMRLQRDYGRIAWGILIIAFILFWTVGIALCFGVARLRTMAAGQPERPAVLTTFVREVEIYRRGLVQPEKPSPPAPTLFEGDGVRVAPTAPPGIAATIRLFDGSTIDLWPDTQVTLDEVQTTRFNNRSQRVRIRLERGMMRVKLVQPSNQLYANVEYTVLIERPGMPLEQAVLGLGGTYRLRVLEAGAPTTSESESTVLGSTVRSEYVVERGDMLAEFGAHQQPIRAGEKILTDDTGFSKPLPTEWQLLVDGQFSRYTAEEYNNTTKSELSPDDVRSDTWFVSGDLYSPQATSDGYFVLIEGACVEWRDGIEQGECRKPVSHVAEFIRMDPPGHTESFKTSITQTINLDTTAYSTLELAFHGRILHQSINRAGFIGEECTLGVMIRFLNETDQEGSHTFCFYTRDVPTEAGAISNKSYISTIKLVEKQWSLQSLDLLKYVPEMRKLIAIEFYGNGHDYQSQIADIRLVAR